MKLSILCFVLAFAVGAVGMNWPRSEAPLAGTGPATRESSVAEREPGQETLWSDLARRHYDVYQPARLAKAGLKIEWLGTILLIGNYQGTYEPCGCSSGQSGGHSWEIAARRGLAEALGGEVRTAAIGLDVEGTRPTRVGRVEQQYRRLNAKYLTQYLGETGVDLWTPSASDQAYLEDEDLMLRAPGLRPVWKGGRELVSRYGTGSAGEVVVSLASPGPSHGATDAWKPREGAFPITVAVVHANEDAQAEGARRIAPPGTILVEVGGNQPATGRSTGTVLNWGLGQGTTIAVLRFAVLSSVDEPRSPSELAPKLVDLARLQRSLMFLDAGSGSERVSVRTGQLPAIAFDWWTVPVWHQGERDVDWEERIRDLRVRREALLASLTAKSSVAAGDLNCAECHQDHVDAWKSGPHAKAMATLVRDGRDRDPSCLRCHSTAFREGWNESKVRSVTCWSCHPGIDESHAQGASATRRVMAESVCRSCHTRFASSGFDYEEHRAHVGCVTVREAHADR